MGKTWRCPECETINTDDKCVVCGTAREYNDNDNIDNNIIIIKMTISDVNHTFKNQGYHFSKSKNDVIFKDTDDKFIDTRNTDYNIFRYIVLKVIAILIISAVAFGFVFVLCNIVGSIT